MPEPDPSPEDEPKIIVDDNWKEQVAKEKEALNHSTAAEVASEVAAEQTSEASSSSEERKTASAQMPAPPPASFEMLITMMFTQAMSMLGQIPDPTTGDTQVNKPFAKHYIDTLEMIGEKTKGNLTDEETKMHGEALHALRMAYVSTKAT